MPRADQPLLLLDVDGTVIPFGRHDGHRSAATTPGPYLASIDPDLGTRLAALPCVLVWATAWEDEADTELAPLLGQPPRRPFAWVDDEIAGTDNSWVEKSEWRRVLWACIGNSRIPRRFGRG